MANYKRISRKFFEKVKTSDRRQYEIAHLSDMTPTTLSQFLKGIRLARVGDSRIIKAGAIVGLRPEECWEDENNG